MKCHILFSGKNKKKISKCRPLKILFRVLSVRLKKKILIWSHVLAKNNGEFVGVMTDLINNL